MHRLKNKYQNKRALVIFGGPSLIEQQFDFKKIKSKDYITFLDTKALTPYLLNAGFKPDFYLMPFPEKSKDNGLQQSIYRSFLAQSNIRLLLKKKYHSEYFNLKNNFDNYFESWRPHRGAHKRYKWKKDVYLKDSPFDLLKNIPDAKIIANRSLLKEYFSEFIYNNQIYFFDFMDEGAKSFNFEQYFNPIEKKGEVLFQSVNFLNSAAIVLYPILHFMGFRDIYFLGMDMTMLGTLEYSAPYIFKSMLHYRWFFYKSKQAFNSAYKVNKPYYYRPQSEFEDSAKIFSYKNIKFKRIYEPSRYGVPFDGIETISIKDFLGN